MNTPSLNTQLANLKHKTNTARFNWYLSTVQAPYESVLLIETALGLEGHSLMKHVGIKSNKVSN